MPRLRKEFLDGLSSPDDPPKKKSSNGYDVKATGKDKEAVDYSQREVPRIGTVKPVMKKGPDGKETNEPVGRQWTAQDPKMSQHIAL